MMMNLKCLLCEHTGTVCLDLGDTDEFVCWKCHGEFSRGDVIEAIRGWQQCLKWVDDQGLEPVPIDDGRVPTIVKPRREPKPKRRKAA